MTRSRIVEVVSIALCVLCMSPEVRSEQGCLVLEMHNTGEPSHEESTEHHPQAQVGLYHDVDSYMDIPWAMGNVVSPAVASGCLIKLLNQLHRRVGGR